MDKPKKLILDYSKWRCGGDNGQNKLGDGTVALLNKEGFMCCLGQWHLQLGATMEELLDNGEPNELKEAIFPFSYEDEDDYDDDGACKRLRNTGLSGCAIGINDDSDTTPEEKIKALTKLLAFEGIELEVINKP